jgi:hypothetical protein
MALQPLDLGHFFSFLKFYSVGRTPWTEVQSVARPLPNKRTQTSMPQLGFEPTIPVHALDHAVTMIGLCTYLYVVSAGS